MYKLCVVTLAVLALLGCAPHGVRAPALAPAARRAVLGALYASPPVVVGAAGPECVDDGF